MFCAVSFTIAREGGGENLNAHAGKEQLHKF